MNSAINRYFSSDGEYYCDFKLCKTEEKMIIMYTNAQSCANMRTHDEIKLFVQKCACEIDVIIISETWYTKNETQIYEIAGYNAIHSCRATRGGGVSVYVKSNIAIIDYHIINAATMQLA